MEQKDYKAIAEIIKENSYQFKNEVSRIAFQLADYFEKEENKLIPNEPFKEPEPYKPFNKEQFFKDAAVQE